jgi:DNA-binding response OmpR family regulator
MNSDMSIVPRHVLVADDDPVLLRLLTLNLETEGFVVETAVDGKQARKAALRSRPDLAILDVMMPKMDGFEVLRALRTASSTRDVPVIMLTARATDGDMWEGWKAGADYYVTKPFQVDELLAFVHHLFDGAPAVA